jgi:hypothetical protein
MSCTFASIVVVVVVVVVVMVVVVVAVAVGVVGVVVVVAATSTLEVCRISADKKSRCIPLLVCSGCATDPKKLIDVALWLLKRRSS